MPPTTTRQTLHARWSHIQHPPTFLSFIDNVSTAIIQDLHINHGIDIHDPATAELVLRLMDSVYMGGGIMAKHLAEDPRAHGVFTERGVTVTEAGMKSFMVLLADVARRWTPHE